jgi:hypothetical protein
MQTLTLAHLRRAQYFIGIEIPNHNEEENEKSTPQFIIKSNYNPTYHLQSIHEYGIRLVTTNNKRNMVRMKMNSKLSEIIFSAFMDSNHLSKCSGIFSKIDFLRRVDDSHDELAAQLNLKVFQSPCELSRYFFQTKDAFYCLFCSVVRGNRKIPFGSFIVRKDGLVSFEIEIDWGNSLLSSLLIWVGSLSDWVIGQVLIEFFMKLYEHVELEKDNIPLFIWPTLSSSLPTATTTTNTVTTDDTRDQIIIPENISSFPPSSSNNNNNESLSILENRIYNFGQSEVRKIPNSNYSSTDISVWWDRGLIPNAYQVRGPNYLVDKIKIPAGPSIMEPIDMVLRFSKDPIKRVISERWFQEQHYQIPNRPFLFITNFVLPDVGNWLAFWARREGVEKDPIFERMLQDYMQGDDEFRDQRLKIIPGIGKGSFIAKSAIGNKPGIVGTKMKTQYYQGQNCFEVVVDVSSSATAASLMGVVSKFASGLDLELAFLFESKSKDELPERIIGGVGIHQPKLIPPWNQ